ncbi:nitric oxide reductase NorD protein [Aquimarina sp. EL_43]|uniref:nitric oxide reductase activation protein NorD n=1 Tax=unclassified Aquimarina TaxID=2627091 RepID=UPI0018CA92C3|nr:MULTISPECIES: NorD protein [unclassified Aquimarina]MBG6129870.1 nitric oxide reductase NorD protein [Aquimarina sp. EL_35]MBG6150935.1 nitric oxide reductase NorD protein [Aquimarina sp. EL_32]MBG6167758.1 nitric oxide reductase NorD protein [Aquimarina sp. EL_43]
MFEPDEYIYSKVVSFLKRRKKKSQEKNQFAVKLEDIKPRLTILARAITGEAIELFEAEREGGYKNNNFFLPTRFSEFLTIEENISFYVFRTVYLSMQKKLGFNFTPADEYAIEEAQKKARETSDKVLIEVQGQFPFVLEIYQKLKTCFEAITPKEKQPDFTYIYGKWMSNDPFLKPKYELKNFSEKAKEAILDEIKTTLKANAVEEIVNIEVDKKTQEDYVLTHNFEKVETAEEYDGGWRDFDGDDELEEHANALEELTMKHTVRVDDPTHSVYQADFIENTTISESIEADTKGYHISYDEWDCSKRNYKPDFCKVYPKNQIETDIEYYKKTLKENASTLMGLRKMLTSVNNKYQQQRRQVQGEEFDLDMITDLFTDVHSGHTPSDKVYVSKRKKEKDLSILLLLDVSLSSDGYAAGNKVIDVEKQVSIIFGEILNEFGVDFSIQCFYSKTRNYSTYITLKGFEDDWNTSKFKIGAVSPCGYTRIGAALRHSGMLMDQRTTKNKWVILISDGKPNDYDKYEGKYGINDVKQALRELNQRQINSYALAIEAQAKYYLPQMFGQNHYQILTTPVELLQSLVQLYEKIKYQN